MNASDAPNSLLVWNNKFDVSIYKILNYYKK